MKLRIFSLLLIIGISACKSQYEPTIPSALDKEATQFVIQNSKDTFIEGTEGTLIFIERGSFVNDMGEPITDSIEISLKEVYSLSDIVGQPISTSSGEDLLETSGMIELRASSNGENLRLNYGKSLVVHFPKEPGDTTKMHLFYGDRDTAGTIGWKQETSFKYGFRDSIQPWYYKRDSMDNPHLILADGTYWYDTLEQMFNLTDRDRKELVNEVVDLNYVVYMDGVLEFKNTTGSSISRRLRRKLEKVARNFPPCKPYTVMGQPIEMEGFFKVSTIVVKPPHQTKEAYKAALESRIKSADGTKKGLELAELQYYIFDSRQLGWMNCDRFINTSAERIKYVVQVPASDKVLAKIIFTNYRTVMSGNATPGQFTFANLPVGEPIKVVVMDEKRGKPLLKIVDAQISKTPLNATELDNYTLEELQEKLKGLD